VLYALFNTIHRLDLNDLDKYIYIDLVEYANMYGVSERTAYRDFKAAIEELDKRKFTYKEDDIHVSWNFMRSVRYREENKYLLEVLWEKGIIDDLIPNRTLGNYMKGKIAHGKYFVNVYSFNLYRLLKQHTFKGKVVISIRDLYKTLGIEDNEYPLYGNFKQRVIVPAVTEINAITEILVKYKKSNSGKATTELTFTMGAKEWVEKYR